MNKMMITGGTAAGVALAIGVAGLVSAQSAAEATGLSEEQIIEIALLEVPGEVQEFELEERRRGDVYEVEILDAAGDEVEVVIDPATGEVLRVKTEDKDCDDDDDDDDEGDDDV